MSAQGIYKPDDTLTFGKHEGEKLEDVIVDDPTYVAWCCDEIDGFELDEEAAQLLETSMRSLR